MTTGGGVGGFSSFAPPPGASRSDKNIHSTTPKQQQRGNRDVYDNTDVDSSLSTPTISRPASANASRPPFKKTNSHGPGVTILTPQSVASTTSGSGPGPNAGIFVFEADTAAFANRKRAARACASCQKRKKRCPHTFSNQSNSSSLGPTVPGAKPGVKSSVAGLLNDLDEGDDGGKGAEKVLPNLVHKEPVLYVGDLNPESILTDLSTGEKRAKRLARIGVWVEQSKLGNGAPRIGGVLPELHPAVPATPGDTATAVIAAGTTTGPAAVKAGVEKTTARRERPNDIRQAAVEKYSKIERGRRTLTGHQKNYLQAVGAFRVLPKQTEDLLVMTYMACVDPLLPLIDGRKFLQEYRAGEASVFLVQAICMVACKTEEAAGYLRLYEDGPQLDPIPFARSLHTGLDAAMKADLESDRFTKVQIMALMSLHNDGPGGIEESSIWLVQAVHDAQTAGMHINTPGRTRNDQGAQLWWCLWMMDKYNACLGGRPLMISERDIDIEEPDFERSERGQALNVWMKLGHLLDLVIEFYRPIADPDATGWEQDFPSWHDLTEDCEMDLLLPSHKNVLELCYNIIGILACRSGGPTTDSYNRRIVCADRIQSLLQHDHGTRISPIPLVPYAVSLSLTVVYRSLRDHHADSTKLLSDLTTRCEMLESLSKTWWTADAMAKLGRKALTSLQQPNASQAANRNEITDAMDVEVTPCKYAPLFGSGQSPKASTGNTPAERHFSNTSQDDLNGNALHVLSDAAATHGQPKRASGSKKFTRGGQNNDDDLRAKRRRIDMNKHSSMPSGPPYNSATSAGSSPVTLMHSNTTTQDTPTSMSSYTDPGHADGSSSSHLTPQNVPGTTTPAMFDPAAVFNPSSTDAAFAGTTASNANGAGYEYNALDTLFDGFFDLAMPTIFQDPLFDGAAFNNWMDGFDGYSGFIDPGTAMNNNMGTTGSINMGMGGAMGAGMGGVGVFDYASGSAIGSGFVGAGAGGVNAMGGHGHGQRHSQ